MLIRCICVLMCHHELYLFFYMVMVAGTYLENGREALTQLNFTLLLENKCSASLDLSHLFLVVRYRCFWIVMSFTANRLQNFSLRLSWLIEN